MIPFSFTIIILSLFASLTKSWATPECSLYYGQPDSTACQQLLMAEPRLGDPGGLSWIDGRSHFFSLAPRPRIRPPGLTKDNGCSGGLFRFSVRMVNDRRLTSLILYRSGR